MSPSAVSFAPLYRGRAKGRTPPRPCERVEVVKTAGANSSSWGDLEESPSWLDERSLRLEERSLWPEERSLRLDERSLRLDERSLWLEERSLRLDERSLRLDESSLRLDESSRRLDEVLFGWTPLASLRCSISATQVA